MRKPLEMTAINLRTGVLACLLALCPLLFATHIGCRTARNSDSGEANFQSYLTQIEYPEVDELSMQSAQEGLAERPPSVSEYEKLEFQDLTLDEAIQMALSNSKVISRIGGQVISVPAGAISTYDPAIQESSRGGVEQALSVFDTNWNTTFNFNRAERKFNNLFQTSFSGNTTNSSRFVSGLSKQTPYGTTWGLSNQIDYSRFQSPVNRFNSSYDMIVRAEFRQAMLRGAGTLVNQVAGPNSAPGIYNGVYIARINQDITLADFETAVRDLVRDVERNYWELYYAYRNLDNLIDGRQATLDSWERRTIRNQVGVERKEIVPNTKQQYFEFQVAVQDALAGNGPNLGLYGSERELRRLIGMNAGGRTLLRPTTDPLIAKADYDWDSLQIGAMERRVELRRQQWLVNQRQLEYLAAQNLNKWQLDFVANYGWRGFGDNLFGSTSRPEGSAVNDLFSGDLDDWNMGFEFGGPIGKRSTFVAVKNAELQLAKSRAVLREQQRQVVLNLNRAFVEVDRSYASIRANYNSRDAINEELRIRKEQVDAGLENDFGDLAFQYLDALRRKATTNAAFARSIVDYNLALLDVAYESGQLLGRYNISISEGAWEPAAYENAASRDQRFSN